MINFFLLEIWSFNSESLQYQLVAYRIEKRFPEGMVRNTLFYSNFKHKLHCAKSVRIRSFSGPYFAAFRLNKERYQVSLRIQSECGKIRTRKTPNTELFTQFYFRDCYHWISMRFIWFKHSQRQNFRHNFYSYLNCRIF